MFTPARPRPGGAVVLPPVRSHSPGSAVRGPRAFRGFVVAPRPPLRCARRGAARNTGRSRCLSPTRPSERRQGRTPRVLHSDGRRSAGRTAAHTLAGRPTVPRGKGGREAVFAIGCRPPAETRGGAAMEFPAELGGGRRSEVGGPAGPGATTSAPGRRRLPGVSVPA